MAKLSIEEMLVLIHEVDQLCGKYTKQTLMSLERIRGGRLDGAERKAVLDGMNNFSRAVKSALGYPVER